MVLLNYFLSKTFDHKFKKPFYLRWVCVIMLLNFRASGARNFLHISSGESFKMSATCCIHLFHLYVKFQVFFFATVLTFLFAESQINGNLNVNPIAQKENRLSPRLCSYRIRGCVSFENCCIIKFTYIYANE